MPCSRELIRCPAFANILGVLSHHCLPAVALIATILQLHGCSGGGERASSSPDARFRAYARLQVTTTVDPGGSDVLSSDAQLLRFRDLDFDRASVLAGAGRAPFAALPVGRCRVVEAEALLDGALRGISPDSQVLRLDAGELFIRTGRQSLRLSPTYVPDVLPLVSGTAYEVDGPSEGLAGLHDGTARVSALGGEDVGRFDVEVSLPKVPRLVSLEGAEPHGASLPRADVEVRWVSAAPSAEGVAVVLSFAAAGRVRTEIRCQAPDTGRFVLSGRVLAAVPRWVPSDVGAGREGVPVTLAVERSQRTPFVAAGLDAGEVVVTARDAVEVWID
jgi:hypothetical protein